MAHQHHAQPFPRAALLGAALLIATAFSLAILARSTGVGATGTPDGPIAESYTLQFTDRDDGAVAIFAAGESEPLIVLPGGTNGFVRGVMRGMARERRMHSIGPEEPFELQKTTRGYLLLHDPSTGRLIDLQAFGPDNTGAFADIYAAAASGGS